MSHAEPCSLQTPLYVLFLHNFCMIWHSSFTRLLLQRGVEKFCVTHVDDQIEAGRDDANYAALI